MSKKNKSKQNKQETTAFSKSDWYGTSKRERQRSKNKKNKKNVSRETYKPNKGAMKDYASQVLFDMTAPNDTPNNPAKTPETDTNNTNNAS